MNIEESTQTLLYLSWRLGVRPPKVRPMKRGARRAHYRDSTSTISIEPIEEIDTVLHEMAHHLINARRPRMTRKERSQLRHVWRRDSRKAFDPLATNGRYYSREKAIHHGPAFVRALAEVTAAWPDHQYRWTREYRIVFNEAKRLGLW